MSGERCRHGIAVGGFCAGCDMYDEPATADAEQGAGDVEALLTKTLHDTETTGGWWGHPECQEFARIVTPTVARLIAEAEARGERRGAERAWREGAITALDFATRNEDGITLSLDLEAHPNPYRAAAIARGDS